MIPNKSLPLSAFVTPLVSCTCIQPLILGQSGRETVSRTIIRDVYSPHTKARCKTVNSSARAVDLGFTDYRLFIFFA